jgi:hypothetical protein
MSKFNVVAARCDRYHVEADGEEAALTLIRDAYYKGDLKREYEDQMVDFFAKFESDGEIADEGADD